MDYDHVDFKTALKFLADKAGIDAGNIKLTKKVQKNDHLYEAYRLANIYYQNNLKSVAGKKALDYLKERKINNTLIKKFGIGLSLNKKDDLTKLLLKKKYDLDDLNRIGLSNVDYDMYQDRIMFPLEDIEGNIVGFSGRIYRDSDESKYINTKESSIFKKGLTIYNYQRALEEVRKSKQVIIMEGFMDVIRASSIGVNNAVALMGTAMTNDQLDIIKRMSNNIVLCLDGDSAGKKAALAIGEHFQKKGIEVKVVTIPSDLDPDEFIIKNGEAKFKELVSKAINYSDYKIAALKENINFDSDLELSKYIDQVIKEAVRIDDDIRVELILKNLAKTYNLSYNTLEKRFRDYEKTEKKEQVTIKKPQEIKKITKYDKALYSIIYYMLRDDKVIESMKEKKIIYPNETAKILVNEIIYYYEKYGELEIADFYTYLDGKEELIVLLNEILQLNLPDKIKEEDLAEYIKVVKDYSKNQAIKRLKEKLEKEEDPLEQAKIAEEIKKIKLGE